MLLSQEIIDPDLIGGNIAGRKLQINLDPLKFWVCQNRLFQFLRTLAWMAQIQRREAIGFGRLRDIMVVCLKVNRDTAVSVKHGDHLVVRKQQPVGLVKVFHRVGFATKRGQFWVPVRS